MTICCLGDLVLDVIVRLEQPLAPGADATSRIVLRPGGQAANVAAWVSALGGSSRFVGKRGADDAGLLAASRLAELGVDLVGPVETEGNGVIVSLVDPSGERTMCSDRGVATELRADEIDEAWFDGCAHLHVSGYALLREPVGCAAREAIRVARDAGARVSIDLSSWSAIRDFGAEGFRVSSRSSRPTSSSRTETRIGSSAARSQAATGSSSADRPVRRSTERTVTPLPVEPSSTRPAPATPSPPAGSSAGPSWLSRPARAASRARARCRRDRPRGRLGAR